MKVKGQGLYTYSPYGPISRKSLKNGFINWITVMNRVSLRWDSETQFDIPQFLQFKH